MVVDSILPQAECGPNDHRKNAPRLKSCLLFLKIYKDYYAFQEWHENWISLPITPQEIELSLVSPMYSSLAPHLCICELFSFNLGDVIVACSGIRSIWSLAGMPVVRYWFIW